MYRLGIVPYRYDTGKRKRKISVAGQRQKERLSTETGSATGETDIIRQTRLASPPVTRTCLPVL